jgi:CubicO group peptidase (beta-lactamase class C family)/lysophospholipase L1-like esterase
MRRLGPLILAWFTLFIPRATLAEESPIPQGWEYAPAMKAIAAKGHARPGVVLHIGDSITYANPYSAWARAGKGHTPADTQALKWMHAGTTDDTDGWYLASFDHPDGGRSFTACGGIRADEMLAGGKQRMPKLTDLLDKYKPQAAVLMLGTNDASAQRPLEKYQRDVESILDAMLSRGIVPILSTIPPHVRRPALARSYNDALRAIAKQRQIPLIDFEREILARRPDDWDGTLLARGDVHPTADRAGTTPASAPTAENLRNSGYLLRGWLSVKKIAEVKRAVFDAPSAGASADDYFPPPESKGGWRKPDAPDDIRRLAGMDPAKLAELKDWLLRSDDRDFAAVVIRRGYVVLELERGNSAKTDARRVASVSKAICATVLAIASERSRAGLTPRKMTFDDPAFDFIPWAAPPSDPRKTKITVRQLLNHTSGLSPESTGSRNAGPWEYVFGHTGDPKTARLAFDPGTDLGYSSHAFYHAALVCENVTGKPYDQFTIEALFKPIGVEKWTFGSFDGNQAGRHPNHELGLPARELARVAYCMLHGGRWNDAQVVPEWFVNETAAPTHSVKGIKSFGRDAESWSHGWELPARLTDGRGKGIPADARFKPGSGGQLIAFVPSLDLIISRQTGSSGQWEYEEYLRRACAAALPEQRD